MPPMIPPPKSVSAWFLPLAFEGERARGAALPGLLVTRPQSFTEKAAETPLPVSRVVNAGLAAVQYPSRRQSGGHIFLSSFRGASETSEPGIHGAAGTSGEMDSGLASSRRPGMARVRLLATPLPEL